MKKVMILFYTALVLLALGFIVAVFATGTPNGGALAIGSVILGLSSGLLFEKVHKLTRSEQ